MVDEKHSAAVKAGQARARARNARLDELNVLLRTFGVEINANYYTYHRHQRLRPLDDFRFRLYHMRHVGKIEYFRSLDELTERVHELLSEATNA